MTPSLACPLCGQPVPDQRTARTSLHGQRVHAACAVRYALDLPPDPPPDALPFPPRPPAPDAVRFGRGCQVGMLLGFAGWCAIVGLLAWLWWGG